ncbi:hypothetical protein EYM_01010 [Ignicoccus islandicus DSM 13165]|uniref:Uncharacterized protein n=1 Tax=Ignicoccus islandicus DSM 13165 TaxID=940295 RepID=A0A0U3FQK2_9CREN|nr:hypothetical protein [Ignicoccus islandicus]ALU12167.1 hypothetical protein EYM_01010 [Ignicoccus islandicus DSM 13165]
MRTFEELRNELVKRRDRLRKELAELMREANRLKLLERVCVKLGKTCSIEACYTGIRTSAGVIVLDEGEPKLYKISNCNLSIEEPDTSDMYEALIRLRDITEQSINQLSKLLENL